MVKKIKHYFKFMLCCGLILSLIAPSYAALSASDGSAFVTKAEFDSALADFNARLTTFEAGINSKIDSQVSSYLDRNGIWNGKDQLDWAKLDMAWYTLAELKNFWKGWTSGSYSDNKTDEQLKFQNLNESGNIPSVNVNLDFATMLLTDGQYLTDTSTHYDTKPSCKFREQLYFPEYCWGAPDLTLNCWQDKSIPITKSGLCRCQFVFPSSDMYAGSSLGSILGINPAQLWRNTGYPFAAFGYGDLYNGNDNKGYISFKFMDVMPLSDATGIYHTYEGPYMQYVKDYTTFPGYTPDHYGHWEYKDTENKGYNITATDHVVGWYLNFYAGQKNDLYFFVSKGDQLKLRAKFHWPTYFYMWYQRDVSALRQPWLSQCWVY